MTFIGFIDCQRRVTSLQNWKVWSDWKTLSGFCFVFSYIYFAPKLCLRSEIILLKKIVVIIINPLLSTENKHILASVARVLLRLFKTQWLIRLFSTVHRATTASACSPSHRLLWGFVRCIQILSVFESISKRKTFPSLNGNVTMQHCGFKAGSNCLVPPQLSPLFASGVHNVGLHIK